MKQAKASLPSGEYLIQEVPPPQGKTRRSFITFKNNTMTNEEIIDEYATGFEVRCNDFIYSETEVIKFMDAAREDEAVGFVRWVADNNYHHDYDDIWYPGIFFDRGVTTAELYQLYKQSK